MKRIFKLMAFCAAVTAFLAFPSKSSMALTVQDILVMIGQGVPESVIISVIQGAETLPDMDKSDYAALLEGGASKKLASEIAKRRRLMTATGEEEKSASGVTKKSGENKTLEDGGGLPPAVSEIPGGLQLIQETVLAPVESSNAALVFRKFFEEAHETFMVESQVARRYDELQHASSEAREDDAELPTVAGYRAEISEHPLRSFESCMAMASDRKPHADTALGAALNRCIGESLGALGAEAMGAAYLDMALQSSAVIPDYSPSFKKFLAYAHASDYSSTAPLKIKKHESEIARADRDAFNYFIAYSFIYGPSPDETLAYHILRTIRPGGIEYARARILLATLDVRAPKYHFKTAAENLDDALRALETIDHPDSFMLRNTAWLALARIASENHAYDAADAFYRRVDVNSHHLRDAVLEDAWTQVFGGNYGRALALTHALRAPIFEKSWLPDMLLIEAGAYLGLCRYDMALRSVGALRGTYIGDAAGLRTFMAETPARDYYVQIIRHAEAPEKSKLPARIYNRVISDLRFRTIHRSLKILSDERGKLGARVSREFTSWPQVQKIYDTAIAERQQAMSVILGGIFEAALGELHALDISSSQVAIEVRLSERRREAECLKIMAAGGKCSQTAETAPATLTKGAGDAYWNFDGEFWRDELRAYEANIPSLCQ